MRRGAYSDIYSTLLVASGTATTTATAVSGRSPAATAFPKRFGVVFLGERPSLNGWLGIALICAGAVLIAIKR